MSKTFREILDEAKGELDRVLAEDAPRGVMFAAEAPPAAGALSLDVMQQAYDAIETGTWLGVERSDKVFWSSGALGWEEPFAFTPEIIFAVRLAIGVITQDGPTLTLPRREMGARIRLTAAELSAAKESKGAFVEALKAEQDQYWEKLSADLERTERAYLRNLAYQRGRQWVDWNSVDMVVVEPKSGERLMQVTPNQASAMAAANDAGLDRVFFVNLDSVWTWDRVEGRFTPMAVVNLQPAQAAYIDGLTVAAPPAVPLDQKRSYADAD